MLKFNDGWKVDTSGEYRIVTGPDGLYVVGHGSLIPVDNHEEGEITIREMTEILNHGTRTQN